MKINYENKKPIEDSSSEDEKPKNKNNVQDTSTDVILSTEPSMVLFKKRPGTIINPVIRNRFVSKKDVSKNLVGLKKEIIETTILSNRFKFDEDLNKNPPKKLDNSFEDYWLNAIVDEDSFQKFVTQLNKEKGCFEGLCKCFMKKIKKNKLTRNYDLRNDSLKITLGLAGLIEELKNNFDEKAIETLCPTPLDESKKFCDEKAKIFLEKKGMEERLREEVEYYSKYFKIDSIIEKQKNTLKLQEEKKKKINEIRELNVCIICMEFQRNIMFTPCYHLSCCEKCATDVVKDECPECKKKIEDKIDVNYL